MASAASGQQFAISAGDQHATIVEVGGGIREYRAGDRDVLQPYPAEQMCDAAHGAPLIPWPNRLADGRYTFDHTEYQVSLTEPDKHNAIHGFLHWRPWRPVEQAADRITMAATLFPLQGYPFTLDLRIEYRLDRTGLTVNTTATNSGDRPCPYGCGQHPYLSPAAAWSTTASCNCRPPRASASTPTGNCPRASSPSLAHPSTSVPPGVSAICASTTPSPTSTVTTRAAPGSGSNARTATPPNSGSAKRFPPSSSIQPTPSARTGAAADWNR